MPHYFYNISEMEIGEKPFYKFDNVKHEGDFKVKSDRLSFSERLQEEINIMKELAGITPASERDISQ